MYIHIHCFTMNDYYTKVFIEAFIAAIFVVILWILLDPILPGSDTFKVFVLSFGVHLCFEMGGFNEWICDRRK